MNKTISREEQLFHAAIELDAPDRGAFLAKACAGDESQQIRIEKLVEQHFQNTNVLDFTSGGSNTTKSRTDLDSVGPGSEIGPYKLLQEIGVGGMGVVFMAEQTAPVQRKVAIKIIKPGMDSKNVIARFEAERQALAMMEHPNITKVFDAGVCEAGRPYFVMELITGMSIVKYCDKKKLDLRQRMELFFKVCNAVQHAHQKGVIHRDIKPSNIMVTDLDGVAVPKIIDFGIAKAIDKPLTEKTLFTSYGNMVGTPEYMSPEQAEMNGLDMDTCSDVYSLGVVLYELMTGTTPFFRHRESGLRKFCDAICTEEPELASTRVNNIADTIKEISFNRKIDRRGLNSFLRGDVDWILGKCLEKNRDDRYASAAELANEIKRHLKGEPVLAAAPSSIYRFKKFLTRNRFAVSSAAVVAACLIVTSVVSFAFAARAIKAEKLASLLLAETQEARQTAETERDRALIAQAELRRMERASRREAVQWQAGYRFMNMNDDTTTTLELPQALNSLESESITTTSTTSLKQKFPLADSTRPIRSATLAESEFGQRESGNREKSNTTAVSPRQHRFKFAMEPDGNMCIAGMDNAFHIRFINNCQNLADSDCEIRVEANCDQSREYALQALECVTSEMERRFGEQDLFVAEPKMRLAELQAQSNQWANAEKQLRQVRQILKDKYSGRLLKSKNNILLAVALAKQNKFAEARKVMAEVRSLQNDEEFQKALANVKSAGSGLAVELEGLSETIADIFEDADLDVKQILDSEATEKLQDLSQKISQTKADFAEKLKVNFQKNDESDANSK
ncbi:MAG: serine/threonine protein kinase [Mariniblastus sp.]